MSIQPSQIMTGSITGCAILLIIESLDEYCSDIQRHRYLYEIPVMKTCPDSLACGKQKKLYFEELVIHVTVNLRGHRLVLSSVILHILLGLLASVVLCISTGHRINPARLLKQRSLRVAPTKYQLLRHLRALVFI